MATRCVPITIFILLAVLAAGQQPDPAADIDRLIQDGMAEALEGRLQGGRTPDEKHQLARAYANKARRARAGTWRGLARAIP